MSGEYGENQAFSATIQITGGKSGLRATLQGATPFSETAAKNKYPAQVLIPRVFLQNQSLVLVFASAFGLIEWKLDPTENGYSGKLELGPMKANATLRKL